MIQRGSKQPSCIDNSAAFRDAAQPERHAEVYPTVQRAQLPPLRKKEKSGRRVMQLEARSMPQKHSRAQQMREARHSAAISSTVCALTTPGTHWQTITPAAVSCCFWYRCCCRCIVHNDAADSSVPLQWFFREDDHGCTTTAGEMSVKTPLEAQQGQYKLSTWTAVGKSITQRG